jgi:hypothetical protein
MEQYNFREFLDSISDLSHPEMILEVEREKRAVDQVLFPGRGVKGIDKQYRDQALKYRELLGGFQFFLGQGNKPTGISDWDFQSFRPVTEKLIEKGWLQAEVLSLFETAN